MCDACRDQVASSSRSESCLAHASQFVVFRVAATALVEASSMGRAPAGDAARSCAGLADVAWSWTPAGSGKADTMLNVCRRSL